MAEYIGGRIVPDHGGVWDKSKKYEELTIVLNAATGDSYISRRPVPAGTEIYEEHYWSLYSQYSEQITRAEDHLDNTAAAIRSEMNEQAQQVTQRMEQAEENVDQRATDAETLSNQNRAILENRMSLIEARQEANVHASTDASADYAAELVDARVDDNAHTHASLGANLRALGKIRTWQDILPAWGWQDDKIVHYTGQLTTMGNWSCVYMIPVVGDKVIIEGKFGMMSGDERYHNIWCYDEYRTSLGGCFRCEDNARYFDNEEITLLEGTAYISVSTGKVNKDKCHVYIPPDARGSYLLEHVSTAYEWLNGEVHITHNIDTGEISLSIPDETNCFFLDWNCGGTYKIHNTLRGPINVEFSDTIKEKWWCIYLENDEFHLYVGDKWYLNFKPGRFMICAFYSRYTIYTPVCSLGIYINDVCYGNPEKQAANALNLKRYLGQEAHMEYGEFAIDFDAGTISVTAPILMTSNTRQYFQLAVSEEPTVINEGAITENRPMVIFGYDNRKKELNFYTTAMFQALGEEGFYIASYYQSRFWNAHINPSIYVTIDNGTPRKIGEYFTEEIRDTFIEAKYRRQFELQTGHIGYLASGGIAIDQVENTIQVTDRCLFIGDNLSYTWIYEQEEPIPHVFDTPMESGSMPMRILGYDNATRTINLYDNATFKALGVNGYYLGTFYQDKLYDNRLHPGFKVTLDGVVYRAGDLVFQGNMGAHQTPVENRVDKNVQDYVAAKVNEAEIEITKDVAGVSAEYANPLDLYKTFLKVGVIGDSLSVGYMYNLVTETANGRMLEYSWPKYIGRDAGVPWLNLGASGQSVLTWCSNSTYGKAQMEAEGNKCQAYIIGLGVNDSSNSDRAVPLGSPSDIVDDPDTVATTYYGGYVRIIQLLKRRNPDCKIFCLTIPANNATQNPYSEAVRYVAEEHFSTEDGVYLIDLAEDYLTRYTGTNPIARDRNKIRSHYSAAGYRLMASLLEEAISRRMLEDQEDFVDVAWIPYDTADPTPNTMHS